jgi:endo-1,4-beta-xylanase
MIVRCISLVGVAALVGACGSSSTGSGSSGDQGSSGASSSGSGTTLGTTTGSTTQPNSGTSTASGSGASTHTNASTSTGSGSSAGSTGTNSGTNTGTGSGTGTATSVNEGSDGGACTVGTLPTTGAMTPVCQNDQGTAASQQWQLWSNTGGSGDCITLYSTPAFSASWDDPGDFLARTGIVWQKPAAYTTYGTITAQFAESKQQTSGNNPLYSYVGIYGWFLPKSASDPQDCIEWYIVDDSFSKMPVNGGGSSPSKMGSQTIDGATYTFYKSSTSGTGGNNCGSAAAFPNWTQYYSVRSSARQCGQISISDHFTAWIAAGMPINGNLQEAQVIVEIGNGGVGTIDFSTASVTATQ